MIDTMTRSTVFGTAARLIGGVLIAAGLLAGLASFARPADAAGDCSVAAAEFGLDSEESDLLARINTYRQQHGAAALAAEGALTKAAAWMARDMVGRNDGVSHVDSLGRNIGPRLTDCGYSGFTGSYSYKENVCCTVSGGASVKTAAQAFEAWRTSTNGHNEAMLEPTMKFAGFGRSCDAQTCYWTLDLGTHKTNTPAPTATSAAPTQTLPLVRMGATGDTVTTIQYLLRQHGAEVDVDGDFGPQTEAAVRAFQQAKGLGVDGIVGPRTFGALFVTVREGSQGDAVRAVQSQLAARGATLDVDGDFGPVTATAVRAFQQQAGLSIDGIVGPRTWSAMVSSR